MRTHLFVFALISLLAACQKENFEETTSELATYTFSQTELDNISRNFCRTIDPEGYDMHAYSGEGHGEGTELRSKDTYFFVFFNVYGHTCPKMCL